MGVQKRDPRTFPRFAVKEKRVHPRATSAAHFSRNFEIKIFGSVRFEARANGRMEDAFFEIGVSFLLFGVYVYTYV